MRVVAVAAAAALFAFLGASPALAPWRARALDATAPLFGVIGRATDAIRDLFGSAQGERIATLEQERTELLAELARREGLVEENALLRETLALRQEGESGAMTAAVIAVFREGRDEYLLLNRGTTDGIGVGDLVITKARVLAGTVVTVAPRTSRVILLTSPSRSIEVTLPGSALRAIARGANNRELIIELVPQDAKLEIGDRIIASPRATGGRDSLLVGEVREAGSSDEAAFKTVRAVHLFDPSENGVIVLLAP